jgi:hypothetical protein
MGREAYRLGVRFVNPEFPKEKVVKELLALGAYDTHKGRYGQVDMEIAFKEGYLEMLVYNLREYRKLLDESLYSSEDLKHMRNEEKPNHTVMEMRFAKLNSVDLVDRIMEVMIKLHQRNIVEKVGDLEVKQTIDIFNYSEFKECVKKAKAEYESWHHSLPYPIRCSEVYDTYHKLYPDEYKITSSDNLK